MSFSRSADTRREGRHNKLLGERLALIRTARGQTLEDVAVAAGVSAAQLQRYEAGEGSISFGRLVEIARALDLPLPALLGDAFGAPDPEASIAPDTGLTLRFARLASRLPRAKRDLLFAVAREMSRP
jgi:transcriptional regulator with XRE-family HTH domain